MIDLHMHSIFSDGSMTPEELIAMGSKLGLKAMALTDHDTVAGVARFQAAAEQANMQVLTGVEVSADIESGTLHVLAYGVDIHNRMLLEHLRWIREGRDERNREILHKLNRMGIRLTMEEVARYAGADVVGRPHIAQALIERKHARDKRDAFDRFLAKGKPAYAERRRLESGSTLELIRLAGGLPIVAHPFTLKRTGKELKSYLADLKQQGLAGIEIYYTEHTPDMQRTYAQLADELGLLVTGGSDYHGSMSPGIHMGSGTGALMVPDDVYHSLIAALGRNN